MFKQQNLKLFFKENKHGFMWSVLLFVSLGLFFGLIKKWDMNATVISILAGIPLMFLMAYWH